MNISLTRIGLLEGVLAWLIKAYKFMSFCMLSRTLIWYLVFDLSLKKTLELLLEGGDVFLSSLEIEVTSYSSELSVTFIPPYFGVWDKVLCFLDISGLKYDFILVYVLLRSLDITWRLFLYVFCFEGLISFLVFMTVSIPSGRFENTFCTFLYLSNAVNVSWNLLILSLLTSRLWETWST